MMAEKSKKSKGPPWRLLSERATLLCAMQDARARRKRQHHVIATGMKSKRTNADHRASNTYGLIKKRKFSDTDQGSQSLNFEPEHTHASEYALIAAKAADQLSLTATLQDSWEVDSGFCSEASPPASGRSSPCLGPGPTTTTTTTTTVVALDCEMVGTGPGGRCSELARCSVLDYHGNVLYDKYVRPCQPVTNFRTRWSGIRRHHLRNATPFTQAREEILRILEGKVVVGHSIYNDFEALDMLHPGHMVRDTSTTRFLGRLAGFSRERCASLKSLASLLLNRKIQAGTGGHCSVEDARASLDLYKLVEGEWERDLQNKLRGDDAPLQPSFASSNHYMQDEYWPEDVTADGQ